MKAKTLQIHWHEKQPVYSCHFEPLEPFRLATCGADSCIRVTLNHSHILEEDLLMLLVDLAH
jgi:hypothetical protein